MAQCPSVRRQARPPVAHDPALAAGVGRHRRLEGQPPGVVGHAVRHQRPLRHQVVAVHDHAVQRAAGRQQLGLAAGADSCGRSARRPPGFSTPMKLPESSVSAALLPNTSAQLLAGVVGAAERRCVVMSKSNLSRRCWYSAKSTGRKSQRDAQLFQVAHPGRDGAHAAFAAVQVLEHHGLAFGVAQRAVAVRPAGLLEQGLGARAGWRAATGRRRRCCGGSVHRAEHRRRAACRASGSSSASSSGDGVPVAAQSVLPNRPCTRG